MARIAGTLSMLTLPGTLGLLLDDAVGLSLLKDAEAKKEELRATSSSVPGRGHAICLRAFAFPIGAEARVKCKAGLDRRT